MRAVLGYLRCVDYCDVVGALHSRQAVSDHDHGASTHQALECALYFGFCAWVEVGRCFVKHQYRWIDKRCTRKSNQLALAR
jgi:hypothetical protein